MTQNKFFQSRTAIITLIAACAVVFISLGVRQTFGLFFTDFKEDLGISITNSGLAVGIQMLMWGLTGPIFGAIADKYGGHKAISLAFSKNEPLTRIVKRERKRPGCVRGRPPHGVSASGPATRGLINC